jgi:translocation and assembly module TamA
MPGVSGPVIRPTRVRVAACANNRYVNPRGHRFEGALSVSSVISSLAVDYVIPGDDPGRESFSVGARLAHEDNDSSVSDSATLIARHTIESAGWTQSRFIELLHETSEVGEEDTVATLLMPGVTFDRVQADDLFKTRRGYRVFAEGRAAADALLSTTDLLSFSARVKGIYRFGEGGRVTGRTDLGTLFLANIDDLPASLRFFAGGDNSVRGYAWKSLGPKDADGDVRGGKHLLTGSLEYEHPVFGDDWWAGAFIDAGNAFDSSDFEVRYGYGGGARWYSPVGRLRLDLAFPDDREQDDWRIHFSLGADL